MEELLTYDHVKGWGSVQTDLFDTWGGGDGDFFKSINMTCFGSFGSDIDAVVSLYGEDRTDKLAPYKFIVLVSVGDNCYQIAVNDLPSLLELLVKLHPLISDNRLAESNCNLAVMRDAAEYSEDYAAFKRDRRLNEERHKMLMGKKKIS